MNGNRKKHVIKFLKGILPNSKLIMLNSMGKPYSVNRFTTVYQGWGYSNSIDGISFMASRDIRVMGFGVYTPDKEKNVLNGVVKFISGNDAKGSILCSKEINVSKDENDSENKIARVYFDRPIRIKAGEQYCCVVEIKSGNSFYGSGGKIKKKKKFIKNYSLLMIFSCGNQKLIINFCYYS